MAENNIKQAFKVWGNLGNIPINNDDQIEQNFKHFEKGTDRFEIWFWIEETFDISIAETFFSGTNATDLITSDDK